MSEKSIILTSKQSNLSHSWVTYLTCHIFRVGFEPGYTATIKHNVPLGLVYGRFRLLRAMEEVRKVALLGPWQCWQNNAFTHVERWPKIDRPGAASEDELRQIFGLYGQTTGKGTVSRSELHGRPLELFMCSVLKRQGYGEGFRWIAQYLD